MRSNTFVPLRTAAISLVSGLLLVLLAGPNAMAQQKDAARQASQRAQEQITVVAPRIMRTKLRRPGAGAIGYYDMLTLTHQVSYSDLDLATPDGAKMLKDRIENAANEICKELADVNPAEPKSGECVRQAIRGATLQADAAIAAAKK